MKKAYKKIIIGVIPIFIIIGIMFVSKKPVVVKAHKVTNGNVVKYIEEIGTIKAFEQEKIYAQRSGIIGEIYVEEGDLIDSKTLLAKIDTKDNGLDIKVLEEKINGLKASFNNDKIQAQLKADADLENYYEAKRKLDNIQNLYEQGVVAQEQYKIALNGYAISENTLKSSQETLKIYNSKEMNNEYESQIKGLEYEIKKLKNKENDGFIYAIIDGKILDVYVKENEYVNMGDNLFELGNTNKYYIEADVLGEEILNLREGSKVLIEDEDIDIKESGKIRKIYPKAFSKKSDLGIDQKRVKIEIDFDNQDLSKLRVGYEVDIKLIEEVKEDTLYISKNSLFKYKGKDYVFIIKDDKTVLKEIKIGLKGEENVEVIGGLKERDLVILSPGDDLEDGIKVSVSKELK